MGNFKCDRELCQKLLAEFTGTAMLMTLGCTCSVGFPATSGPGNFNVNYSIGWGLSYMAAIHTFAFLSGAHLNPWVSLGAGIFGIMEITTMCLYLIMQVLGCLLGTAFALFVAPDNAKDVCVTYTGQPIGRVIGFEFLATSLLMFAYCALWDRRSNFTFDSMSLRIGLIIGGLCYAISTYTGCSVNFFRSFAPALIALNFNDLWCYFVGQVLSLLVPILWRLVIEDAEPDIRY